MTERRGNSLLRRAILTGTTLAIVGAGVGLASMESSKPATATDASPVTLGGSPEPSAAGGTPSPEASITVSFDRDNAGCTLSDDTYHCLKGGKIAVVPGDMLKGDWAMSNTDGSTIRFLFDQDSTKGPGVDIDHTGLLVDVQTNGEAYAANGGDVIMGLGDRKDSWIALTKSSMATGGCVDGCSERVDVVTWTGFDSTIDQGQLEKGVQPSPTPEPSATPTASIYEVNPETDSFLASVLAMDENSDEFKNMTEDQKLAVEQVKLDYANEQFNAALLKELQSCGCVPACPAPSATPTPNPTPTPTPQACPELTQDHVMLKGETYVVPAGHAFIAQGDDYIDGKRYFDNAAITAAIDVVLNDGKKHTIESLVGGTDVTIFCPTALKTDVLNTYKHDLMALKDRNRRLDRRSLNQLN